jgi:hypothetical protein
MPKARNTKPAVDPIFAAIEAHRRALIARDLALDAFGKAEQEIPSELRKSYFLSRRRCGEEHDHIVDTDAQEWLEVSRAWIEAMDAEFLAAIELTNIKPATIAGVAAVTAYYTQMMALDPCWPEELIDEDAGDTVPQSFETCLSRNLAAALAQINEPARL